MCDMTPLYVCHASFIYDMTLSHVGHASFTSTLTSVTFFTRCVTWLLGTCDMTYSFMTWPIHRVTPLPVWRDSFTCGTWLIDMWHSVRDVYHLTCDMTPWHVWRDSFTREHYSFACANFDRWYENPKKICHVGNRQNFYEGYGLFSEWKPSTLGKDEFICGMWLFDMWMCGSLTCECVALWDVNGNPKRSDFGTHVTPKTFTHIPKTRIELRHMRPRSCGK